MIASLQGTVDSISTDSIVVNVAGVGFKVSVPTSIISEGGVIGGQIKLYTYLHVREDELSLYGFQSPDGLRLFQLLLTVSGLGPRTALAMLSGINPDQLTLAIASGSTEMLTSIPGIGKRTADRIVLELKDKIGTVMIAATASEVMKENADVVAALISLGYSMAEATKAVASLPDSSKLTLEEKIKLALQGVGK